MNVVNMFGTWSFDVNQIHQIWGPWNDTIDTTTSTATLPARVSQFVPRLLPFFDSDPTEWVVYDTLQPNVTVTCEVQGASVMLNPSVTHLNFRDGEGQLLKHTMLKTDLFPNATNTTGVGSASSLMLDLRMNDIDVTQVWRDLPDNSSNFSSIMALRWWGGWWDPDPNHTASRGVTTCAILAEWIPVQANYSSGEKSLTYQHARSTSSHANSEERPAIHLSSA